MTSKGFAGCVGGVYRVLSPLLLQGLSISSSIVYQDSPVLELAGLGLGST